MRIFLIFFFLLFFNCVIAEEINISTIEISGNEELDENFVKSYLNIDLPAIMKTEDIEFLIERLYQTKLFSNVDINIDNNVMQIILTENSIVRKINFIGNKKIKNKDLSVVLSFKPQDMLIERTIHNSTNAIIELYNQKSKFNTTVKPEIVQTVTKGVVDVIFHISETRTLKIQEINFYGNKIFSTKQLREAIGIKNNLWSKIFSNNAYQKKKIKIYEEMLKYFYEIHGYADFDILSATKEVDGNTIKIGFIVDEGSIYNFGQIGISHSIDGVDVNYLLANLNAKIGDLYSYSTINDDLFFIKKYLDNMDYVFAEVVPHHKYENDNNIAIEYFISSDIKNHINKIIISGNVRTSDEVIRREMLVSEGDPYNIGLISRSRNRLLNLDFFDKVNLITQKSEKGGVNLKIEVEEKKTGEFDFGLGISSGWNISGNFYTKEKNILGTGQEVLFLIKKMTNGYDLEVGMYNPYVLSSSFSGGFKLSMTQRDNEKVNSYIMSSLSGSVYGSHEIGENTQATLRYSYGVTDISNIPDDASIYIKDQAGKNTTSLIGYEWRYNKLNNNIDPSDGYLLSFSQGWAGLGGDSKYISSELKGRYFYDLGLKNKMLPLHNTILQAKFKTAYINGYDNYLLKINERFFVGTDHIRGFDVVGIGPRDGLTKEALGAKFFAASTIQISKTITLLSRLTHCKGYIFFDIGTAFGVDKDTNNILDSKSIRASAGFGWLVRSPIGPVRIDWGFPVSKEDFDKEKIMRFGFGKEF